MTASSGRSLEHYCLLHSLSLSPVFGAVSYITILPSPSLSFVTLSPSFSSHVPMFIFSTIPFFFLYTFSPFSDCLSLYSVLSFSPSLFSSPFLSNSSLKPSFDIASGDAYIFNSGITNNFLSLISIFRT